MDSTVRVNYCKYMVLTRMAVAGWAFRLKMSKPAYCQHVSSTTMGACARNAHPIRKNNEREKNEKSLYKGRPTIHNLAHDLAGRVCSTETQGGVA